MGNEKTLLVLVALGILLPSYMGIIISHYKDSYLTASTFQDIVRSLIFAVVQSCRVDGNVLWKWLWMLWTKYKTQYSGQSVTCDLSRNLVFYTSSCELSLQTTLIRDCVRHLAMYWTPKKSLEFSNKKIYLATIFFWFCCFVKYIRTVFPLLSVQTRCCAR